MRLTRAQIINLGEYLVARDFDAFENVLKDIGVPDQHAGTLRNSAERYATLPEGAEKAAAWWQRVAPDFRYVGAADIPDEIVAICTQLGGTRRMGTELYLRTEHIYGYLIAKAYLDGQIDLDRVVEREVTSLQIFHESVRLAQTFDEAVDHLDLEIVE